jgi:hypothetical protein
MWSLFFDWPNEVTLICELTVYPFRFSKLQAKKTNRN